MKKMTQFLILMTFLGLTSTSFAHGGGKSEEKSFYHHNYDEDSDADYYSEGKKAKKRNKNRNSSREHHSDRSKENHSDRYMMKMLRSVDITDEQKSSIKSLYKQHHQAMRDDLKTNHNPREMLLGMMLGNFSDEQMNEFAEQRASLMKENILNRLRLSKKVWDEILTDEQKEKLQAKFVDKK